MSKSSNSGNGIGCFTVLFMIFLVLKLVHAWSWWWVSAPLWMPVTGLLLFYAFCYGMAKLADQR